MTGIEINGEGVVDVAVVPDFPVNSPRIVPSSEHLLCHVEVLYCDQIGHRDCEQDPYTRLVVRVILTGCDYPDLVGLIGKPIRHRQQQQNGAVSSKWIYPEALLRI